jgi:hypothetical protein
MDQYLGRVSQCVRGGDGASLSNLMALSPLRAEEMDLARYVNNKAKSHDQLEEECRRGLRGLDSGVCVVVAYRLAALGHLAANSYDDAYKSVHNCYNAIMDFISSSDQTAFMTPVFVRVLNDLRECACIADKSKPERERLSNPCLRDSQNSITRGFTLVKKDRKPLTDPSTRKLTIFAVTNVLFKIYFKLNTLQLCSKLINLVETRDTMENLRLFPVSDVVTYKYYVGRLKMFEDQYEEARDCLRFTLQFCPRRCVRNRQLILASLVPIEMALGVMPSQKVASEYGLTLLVDIGEAVRRGDLSSFNMLVQQNRPSFIRLGIYLVIEQLKMVVYRNLFKRIQQITDSTRLSLHMFQSVTTWLGESMDLDEIECILSNLIFKNIVKGYLSHQKRIMVIGKSDPFPIGSITKRAKV